MWQCVLLPSSPSPTFGISPQTIPPQLPTCCPSPIPPTRPRCVMFPYLHPCVLIIQHPLSENMLRLDFCSWVSLLRMTISRFIHVSSKGMNSSFLWLHGIPWYICATFSLSSLSRMGIWAGSKSLLL